MAKYYAQVLIEVVAGSDTEAIESANGVLRIIDIFDISCYGTRVNTVTKQEGLKNTDIFDWENPDGKTKPPFISREQGAKLRGL